MKTKVQQSRWGCVLFSWLGVLWLGCVPDALAQHQQLQGHVPAAVARLTSTGRLSATTNLYLSIGLPLRNQEVLSDLLRQIYDPASPNYRHYLTPEQFAEQFGPHPTNYQAVVNFVTAHGLKVRGTHSNRVVLDVEGSVASIEQALHVTLRTYRHPTEGRTFHAPDTEPALDLAVPVLDISGLENFTVPRPMARMQPLAPKAQATPSAGSGSGGTFLAADLRAAYVPGTTLNGTGQSVGLLQFDGYYSNDIASYIAQAGITTSVMLTNIAVDGGISTPGTGNGEVCLDIEMALAMAPGLSKIYVYEAPNSTAYWNDLLNRMATDNQAKQLSCSWSGGGVNATGEQIFRQMAAQGQSFFCASGDCDAFIGTTNACGFPTDSTNITIVGGTTLTTTGGGGSYVSEAVWNLRTTNTQAHGYWGSSGGISANYNLPIYQQGLDMTTNLGSITKRNVPDVALTAANIFGVCNNGASVTFSGTSAAAPLWAGFTALVNQRATANGQAPVGFLNPPLYAIGKGANYTNCFHDTTSGDNTWPNISNKFYAVTGYDLCTGWGTPNGTNLINALMLGPTVLGATPSNSPLTGGITVTITGISLGNGDITGVTLCGVPATLLNDNSPSQVVVSAGTALAPGVGDIVVTSSSAGATTLTNGFT
ncbi:MAG: protease pro-enzyme activation domain-containing protein [Kiritimatiellaeota bacterium]|nr:protease pro-enzyme activation domain-containing protein [Kiritimatiellota bacterium]